MARARNIKPGFYKNEDLAECSIWARFIFPGLWMLADREGRLEDRPKRIKGELLPFDSQDVEPLLRELASKKDAKGLPFIFRYQIDGASYIQISKFKEHQAPHYSEKQSVIKPHLLPEKTGHIEPPISEKTPLRKRGSQPPDSLIPDSLNPESLVPNPDSPNTDSPKRALRAARASPKTTMPDGFQTSERVRAWATGKGFDRLDEHLESFIGKARAKGYTYADWDEGFMGAIRDDWAQIRNGRRASVIDRNAQAAQEWLDQGRPMEKEINPPERAV